MPLWLKTSVSKRAALRQAPKMQDPQCHRPLAKKRRYRRLTLNSNLRGPWSKWTLSQVCWQAAGLQVMVLQVVTDPLARPPRIQCQRAQLWMGPTLPSRSPPGRLAWKLPEAPGKACPGIARLRHPAKGRSALRTRPVLSLQGHSTSGPEPMELILTRSPDLARTAWTAPAPWDPQARPLPRARTRRRAARARRPPERRSRRPPQRVRAPRSGPGRPSHQSAPRQRRRQRVHCQPQAPECPACPRSLSRRAIRLRGLLPLHPPWPDLRPWPCPRTSGLSASMPLPSRCLARPTQRSLSLQARQSVSLWRILWIHLMWRH
mmetsp:Transcript_143191/g.399133  ORF Transcript_143191/g.399133 Transcript_143191/m.399133 type:complete len:319 (+) Transcript_143191:4022-4978(+)